ncbi:hypothetical protein BGZ83_007029 [Gryganskiella cystojenkinii]|nr:hypothetical protein BGZ83_007029 [Gryganskiella cystojenkinii]
MAAILCGVYTVEVNRLYLPLVNVKVHTTILSSSVSTRLTQTFVNSSNTLLRELKYCFPLYEGVSVVAFKARIGDRTIVGEVKEREKAKRDFNAAVAQGQRAALFEQSLAASDVFITSIGNVPAGAKVDVDITYVGELKHDAEVDGTRLTIPARVLPRYGNHNVSLLPLASSIPSGTMDIVVDVTLPRQNSIQKIQSPSHPIAVTLGTTSIAPNAEPALSKASATLALDSVGLDQDFILQVVAKDTGLPTAVLETHPTIPNHRALMATLVPRFVLPLENYPEIVFVIDRSGSMEVKPMELAKSALKVFLKSLPVGVKFNICSFGSYHSFLWKRSMSYTEETLEEAVRHVSVMSSNYRGTEMLQPLKATIEMRFKDMPLEIMLLTDGEIWKQNEIFDYLNKQVAEATSSLRVFTLGVGSNVSHALIEGIAKAGKGFSQAVSDGEKMEGKIVRMLKGAMSPNITDYTLKVKYASTDAMHGERTSSADEEFELVERVVDYLKIGNGSGAINKPETPKKSISLFDTSVDLDGDISMQSDATDSTGQGRYAHLPPLPTPRLLQVPSEIPPLYVFNRTTVYLLMGPECSHQTPKSVVLRGTSKYGPLELEIPIQVLEEKGELVHQLAAKKAIAELEQGRGWLNYARDQITDERLDSKYESRFDEMVEREAVRLGVQFQVGCKWCSFVAVDKRDGDAGKKKKRESQQQKAKAKDNATEDVTADKKEKNKEEATQPKGDSDGELESESEGDDYWDECDSDLPIYVSELTTTATASVAHALKSRAPPTAFASGIQARSHGRASPQAMQQQHYQQQQQQQYPQQLQQQRQMSGMSLLRSAPPRSLGADSYMSSSSSMRSNSSSSSSAGSSKRAKAAPSAGNPTFLQRLMRRDEPSVSSSPTAAFTPSPFEHSSIRVGSASAPAIVPGPRQAYSSQSIQLGAEYPLPAPGGYTAAGLESDATDADYPSLMARNISDESVYTPFSLPAQQSTYASFGSTALHSQSDFGAFGSTEPASSQSTFGGFGSAAPSTQTMKKRVGSNNSGRSPIALTSTATPPAKQLPPLETLIDLQTFSGFWEATSMLAIAVGISLTLLKSEGAALGYNTDEELRIFASVLAISYFENTLTKDRDTWELVVDKAKRWLLTALQGNQDKVDELFAKAAGLLP